MKPEYAVDGERVIVCDAKTPQGGRWVTMRGRKVLIKGGKFVNGPLAGKAYKPRAFELPSGNKGNYVGIKAAKNISKEYRAQAEKSLNELRGSGNKNIGRELDKLPKGVSIIVSEKRNGGGEKHTLHKVGDNKYQWSRSALHSNKGRQLGMETMEDVLSNTFSASEALGQIQNFVEYKTVPYFQIKAYSED